MADRGGPGSSSGTRVRLGTNRGFGRQVTEGLDQLLAAKQEHGPVSLARVAVAARRTLRENVAVRGSHLGLGHNPAVAVVVADRLAQTPETWQPFQPPRWTRPWLPTP